MIEQHEVTVTLKLVHVFLTDRKGNPVVDQGLEDFVVYDNGEKQVVTDFERHIHSFILEKLGKEEKITETEMAEARRLMSWKFFLLFDLAHNNPRKVEAARKAALQSLVNIVNLKAEGQVWGRRLFGL